MKKIFSLALFVMAAILSACGGNPAAKSDALTILGKQSDLQKDYMTRIFDLYRAEKNCEINILSVPDAEYEETATRMFDEGNAPDLFLHFHNADLNRFNVPGNFYNLNLESWVSDLTDSAKNYCTDSEGRLLGLPFWESSVSGCYYNKTILDEIGLNAATTQAEFDMLCEALAEIGHTPICWAANGCSWMMQFGLDPIFADNPELLQKLNSNEITYAEIPQVRSMAEWIGGAAEKGWFGGDFLKQDWDSISSLMGSGQTVMTFIWDTWFYTDFEKGQKYSLEDFALMPVFMNTVEGGTYEGGNLNMMMVNKNSERLEEALEFLSFCATPKNYNIAFDGISTVSCFKHQTTNIQSHMVKNASVSIAEKERVSTAATKIIGYSAEDVADAFDSLFRKKTDISGCLGMMDRYRITEAQKQGIEGF